MPNQKQSLKGLLREIRSCEICREHLPLGPRPVLEATATAKILIVGQAPGVRVHETGVPWNDKSGDRLREWMGVGKEVFYDKSRIAIIPMGFCYPGKGSSGDLPPRPECAPTWHDRLLKLLPDIRLTLLIGKYAQERYLAGRNKESLTETVKAYKSYLPEFLPLVHPSPRNQIWMKKNPWFEKQVVPKLRGLVKSLT